MMRESRISIQNDFPQEAKLPTPYILEINGQSEWVDNLVTFGDLIESQMGADARDFYFEQLYNLLSDLVYFKACEFNNIADDDEEEEPPKENPVAQIVTSKKKKQAKPVGRRLF